jgi:hypothetical protein
MLDTIFFSVGYRCTAATFLNELGLHNESYPFDWAISKLDTVKDCIEDNFNNFLNKENYIKLYCQHFNVCDNEITHVGCGEGYINTYYDKVIGMNSFDSKLCFRHQNILDNYDYFKRSIERFQKILLMNNKKVSIYIHPIIGYETYKLTIIDIINTFISFKTFMDTVTTNLHGVFFIVVKYREQPYKVIQYKDLSIYIIYVDNGFIDGGASFMAHPNKNDIFKTLIMNHK